MELAAARPAGHAVRGRAVLGAARLPAVVPLRAAVHRDGHALRPLPAEHAALPQVRGTTPPPLLILLLALASGPNAAA